MVAPLTRRFRSIWTSMSGMSGASRRWQAWLDTQPDGRPTIWMHAPSIGEALSGEPVIAQLRHRQPDLRIIHTHVSESVREWESPWAADRTDFLPIPLTRSLRRIMDQIKPILLFLPAADLWPGLIKAASANGTPVALTAAAIRSGSARNSAAGHAVHRSLLPRVALIGAVTESDRRKWIALGADAETVHVTGDPRDQALVEQPVSERIGAILKPWVADYPCVVMGSIEAGDMPTVRTILRNLVRRVRFILVPHDPTHRFVAHLGEACDLAGVSWTEWPPGATGLPQTQAIVASGRGQLRDIYRFATVAFVGGGFDRGKTHSIAEPVLFGVPVTTGPEAAYSSQSRFVGAGCTPAHAHHPETSVCEILQGWLDDPMRARAQGLQGRRVLADHAADDTAGLLEQLMLAD